MNFGKALEEMKIGKAIARDGWNGKGMFVYFVAGGSYPAQMDIAKQIVKEYGEVKYNPYMAIKNVNGTVSTWVPSVNDCLATDWHVVGTENKDATPEYILRMKFEIKELEDKIDKAKKFLNKEISKPEKTNERQRAMLFLQIEHMTAYCCVLQDRIHYEENKEMYKEH